MAPMEMGVVPFPYIFHCYIFRAVVLVDSGRLSLVSGRCHICS